MIRCYCPACEVLRTTPDSSKGLEVIASMRAWGLAKRTNKLHQLQAIATPIADRRQATALDVLGGKASPSPLILQFVERLLRIGTVAVELRQCGYVIVQVGDKYRIFVTFGRDV